MRKKVNLLQAECYSLNGYYWAQGNILPIEPVEI